MSTSGDRLKERAKELDRRLTGAPNELPRMDGANDEWNQDVFFLMLLSPAHGKQYLAFTAEGVAKDRVIQEARALLDKRVMAAAPDMVAWCLDTLRENYAEGDNQAIMAISGEAISGIVTGEPHGYEEDFMRERLLGTLSLLLDRFDLDQLGLVSLATDAVTKGLKKGEVWHDLLRETSEEVERKLYTRSRAAFALLAEHGVDLGDGKPGSALRHACDTLDQNVEDRKWARGIICAMLDAGAAWTAVLDGVGPDAESRKVIEDHPKVKAHRLAEAVSVGRGRRENNRKNKL